MYLPHALTPCRIVASSISTIECTYVDGVVWLGDLGKYGVAATLTPIASPSLILLQTLRETDTHGK